MKILVVGANGLLGSNVLTTVHQRGHTPVGTYHTIEPMLEVPCYQLDIRKTDRITALLDKIHPDFVVNCAAMTDVDACEEAPERAREINGEAPRSIAARCAEQNIDFTHVSTDYVFDGESATPYGIQASPNPVQEYGRTKLLGEQAVRENHPDPAVVRLSFVYGIHRGSGELAEFPAWVRGQLRKGERTPLFTDLRVTPTRAGQAAKTILELRERDTTGLFHVACRSCVTPYEFGERIREQMGAPSEYIEEGSIEDVDLLAERPPYSCLDVSSVESALGRKQPVLADDLSAIGSVLQ